MGTQAVELDTHTDSSTGPALVHDTTGALSQLRDERDVRPVQADSGRNVGLHVAACTGTGSGTCTDAQLKL